MKRILSLLAAVSLGSPLARADEPQAPAWPSLEWKKVTPSPFARTEAATALIDGRLYLFGGFIARPPHSPTPVPVLTVSGAAGAKAIS